jgi:hypothetical protein
LQGERENSRSFHALVGRRRNLMNDNDPAKPTPNEEKFKPQNVAEDQRETGRPADTGGRDLPRGSETETRNSSNLRR